MKVRYRALALADLDSIFRFLNERSPTGAGNVLRAIFSWLLVVFIIFWLRSCNRPLFFLFRPLNRRHLFNLDL